jgi:hypothetical protein
MKSTTNNNNLSFCSVVSQQEIAILKEFKNVVEWYAHNPTNEITLLRWESLYGMKIDIAIHIMMNSVFPYDKFLIWLIT